MFILFRCILLLAFLLFTSPLGAVEQIPETAANKNAYDQILTDEDEINLHCLRSAYPDIRNLETDNQGRQWLFFANGNRVLYRAAASEKILSPFANSSAIPGTADIAESMAEPYPLEPERPSTPKGFAPGRLRAYDLLEALYGADKKTVSSRLCTIAWQGKPVRLSASAALALHRVSERLAVLLAEKPHLRSYLANEGGFAWRRIAGEQRLSAHAFGIALDLNAQLAPYWRWSSLKPHPRQLDYPSEIVTAFEAEGFIWGGKWHEYDLMHFEYRPELICKAKLRAKLFNNP